MNARALPPGIGPLIASGRSQKIGAAALARFKAEQVGAPVCGAKAKKTGEPCQQPGMANGRCRVHGGLTPKGDLWHVPRWPSRDSRRPEKKLLAKLATLEKRRKARDARLAAMTPEQRAAFDLWHRRHRAGSAAARRAQGEELRRNAEIAARVADLDTPRPLSAEARALANLADRYEAYAAAIEAETEGRA